MHVLEEELRHMDKQIEGLNKVYEAARWHCEVMNLGFDLFQPIAHDYKLLCPTCGTRTDCTDRYSRALYRGYLEYLKMRTTSLKQLEQSLNYN